MTDKNLLEVELDRHEAAQIMAQHMEEEHADGHEQAQEHAEWLAFHSPIGKLTLDEVKRLASISGFSFMSYHSQCTEICNAWWVNEDELEHEEVLSFVLAALLQPYFTDPREPEVEVFQREASNFMDGGKRLAAGFARIHALAEGLGVDLIHVVKTATLDRDFNEYSFTFVACERCKQVVAIEDDTHNEWSDSLCGDCKKANE